MLSWYSDWDTDWTFEEAWFDSRQRKKLILFPKFPVLLYGLLCFLFIEHRGSLPRGKVRGRVTTHLHLVDMLRTSAVIPTSPHVLHQN
jgi:hypothetical protein